MRTSWRNAWCCLLIGLIVCGCARDGLFTDLERQLKQGDCPAALALMDGGAKAYTANDRLLYLLDAAMAHLQCRDFEASQAFFQSAEDLAEALWTESLSRHAAAMLTNDYALPYAGEDFERVMIHLMSAIAYLQSGASDEALVSFRRLDSLLELYNDRYERKNVYQEDAFARYLSGLLREADGQMDGAFIDYRRAAAVYREDYRAYGTPPPPMIMEDLVHAAAVVDRMADITDLVPDGAVVPGWPPDAGTVVCITFAGDAPRKVQDVVAIPTPHGPVGIAFPRMVVTPPQCAGGRLNLYGEDEFFEAELVLAEDINRIAVKNLDDRKGRIVAKALARAVAKQIAIHSIAHASDNRDQQQVIEAILNIVNLLLMERADTRSWRTLPGRIYMTRLRVPPGRYEVALEICDGRTLDVEPIVVDRGAVHCLFQDLRYPPAAAIGGAD